MGSCGSNMAQNSLKPPTGSSFLTTFETIGDPCDPTLAGALCTLVVPKKFGIEGC